MRLHEIPGDPNLKKGPKRVGRGPGSGHGKTSTRGHKGRQARSGGTKRKHYFEGGQMPLSRRLPKRGFSNRAFKRDVAVVNLGSLNQFDEGATIDLNAFKRQGLVKKNIEVKVLGNGALERKNLTVHAHSFSATARQKIEEAGGSCVVLEAAQQPKPAATDEAR